MVCVIMGLCFPLVLTFCFQFPFGFELVLLWVYLFLLSSLVFFYYDESCSSIKHFDQLEL